MKITTFKLANDCTVEIIEILTIRNEIKYKESLFVAFIDYQKVSFFRS